MDTAKLNKTKLIAFPIIFSITAVCWAVFSTTTFEALVCEILWNVEDMFLRNQWEISPLLNWFFEHRDFGFFLSLFDNEALGMWLALILKPLVCVLILAQAFMFKGLVKSKKFIFSYIGFVILFCIEVTSIFIGRIIPEDAFSIILLVITIIQPAFFAAITTMFISKYKEISEKTKLINS